MEGIKNNYVLLIKFTYQIQFGGFYNNDLKERFAYVPTFNVNDPNYKLAKFTQ